MKKSFVRQFLAAMGVILAIVILADVAVRLILPSGSDRGARSGSQNAETRMYSRLAAPGLSRAKHLVAVMVENHELARLYQEGLSEALLIEEFPVEGFISRFAVIFDADHFPSRVGPVRSLRSYFIDALQPWVSTVIHAGGSPDALDRVRKGDITADNLLYFASEGERDKDIPAPHNLFLRKDKADKLLASPLPGTDWPPYTLGDPWSGSSALTIFLNFHNPSNDVTYAYSMLSNSYVRSSGKVENQGSPQTFSSSRCR